MFGVLDMRVTVLNESAYNVITVSDGFKNVVTVLYKSLDGLFVKEG